MGTAASTQIPVMPVESPEFAANPDPFLIAARREHPWLGRFSQGYVVHGYQELCDLMADDANLIPGLGPLVDFYGVRGTMWADFMEAMMLSQTGAEHARLRQSVAHAFTPRHANQVRPLMQKVISGLLDEWAPKGEFDFAYVASFFPVTVMCGVIGVSAGPVPQMRDALEAQFKSLTLDLAAKPEFLASWDAMWEFADKTVKEREASGEHDPDALLDALIAAKNEGKLSETDLRFVLLTVFIAGYDTSKNQLGLIMNLLLDHPEIYARCAGDKDYCGKVVREALRHSAIASPYRLVANDFTYKDQQFRRGEMLMMSPPLGNRDPSVFPEPEKFDPERENAGRHIAFGRGEHICLGQFIAIAQLQEGLHLIAQRLRNPRLAGERHWRSFLGAWGLASLPIAFDAA